MIAKRQPAALPSPIFVPVLLAATLALGGCDASSFNDMLYGSDFKVSSISMEPTLARGSVISPVEVNPGDLQRGDLVVLDMETEKRVTRLVGLPGDRVAMQQGVVILNGEPVPQRAAGAWQIKNSLPKVDYTLLEEQFPGEAEPHRILDSGMTSGDDFPEIELPEGKYFLLGDNRDRAADSRFPGGAGQFGLGLVDRVQITKRVDAN